MPLHSKNKSFFIIIIGALFFLMVGQSHAAYIPPIGIPAPSFGINEVAPAWPSQWPNAQVNNFYYIDNTHANSTDVNNPYGYPSKPRKTVPTGPFGPGTYIEMNGGPYTTSIAATFNCTLAAPCWLRGGSNTTKTVFTGAGISVQDSSYLIVENFDMNGGVGDGGMSVTGTNTHHIALRHSSIQNKPYPGNNTSAISVIPKNGGTVRDIVIYNMYFAELGDWQATQDQDFHAVVPSLWGRDATATVYNVWFLDSTCFHISGNCIQVNAGNWANSYQYLHHIYIGRNKGSNSRQAAFWSKQASDVIMSENEAFGGRAHGSQPGDGMGYQYRPNNLWIIYNHIYDNNYGIRQSDSAWSSPNNTAYIVGNTIHDIHPLPGNPYNPTDQWRTGTAITFWKGQMNRYVIDNTIYDVHNGITSIETGPIHMSGNLISNIDPTGTFLDVSNAARNGVASFDYSLFYDPQGDFSVAWNYVRYTSLASFILATGQCANCITGFPAFVNPTVGEQANNKHDFRPGTNSAALAANNDLNNSGNNTPDVYAIFQARYGLSIRRDRAGKTRPMIGRSIGAYESSSASGGTPPPQLAPLNAPGLNPPQVN